jgi:gamma-tubulin complex component 2
MLQFIKNYMYYMQVEVIDPNYHKLKAQLRTVKTIDDVMDHHSNFLDECLKQCLLTDQHLVKIISNLNLRTLFFSRVIIRFFNNVKDEETLDRVRGRDEGNNADFFDDLTEYGQTPYSELSKMDQRKRRNKRESDLIKKNISENNYPSILENFERKFNDFMKELLEHLT